MDIILELLKYTLPALVVALVVYIMLKNQADNSYKLKLLQLKNKNSKELVPVKLQAYERLTLFVHRTSPESIFPRLTKPGMTAQELKNAIISAIHQEFEHNITQQVYVSNGVWNAIVAYKNTLANVVNDKAKQLDKSATAYDLGKAVIESYINDEGLLSANQISDIIKQEVKSIFI